MLKRSVLVLLLALSAAVPSPTVAGWDQPGGGPGHPRLLAGSPVALLDLTEADMIVFPEKNGIWSQGPLALRSGPHTYMLGLQYERAPGGCEATSHAGHQEDCHPVLPACRLARLAGLKIQQTPVAGCDGLRLLGVVEDQDVTEVMVLLCRHGQQSTNVVEAVSGNGTVLWGIAGRTLFPNIDRLPHRLVCSGSAVDGEDGVLFVTFTLFTGESPVDEDPRGFDNVVAAVDVSDGAVLWSRQVLPSYFDPDLLGLGAPTEKVENGAFTPTGLSATRNGVVVVGDFHCADEAGSVALRPVAWFSRSGTPMGAHTPRQTLGPACPAGSGGTAGAGHRILVSDSDVAAGALGDDLVVIDTTAPEPVSLVPLSGSGLTFAGIDQPDPAIHGTRVILTHRHGIVQMRTDATTADWTWSGGLTHEVLSAQVMPFGEVWALLARPDRFAVSDPGHHDPTIPPAQLVRLGGARGEEIQRLPIPWRFDRFLSEPHLVPERYELALFPERATSWRLIDNRGNIGTLSEADPALAPDLSITSVYPAVGEPLSLRARIDPGTRPTSIGATATYRSWRQTTVGFPSAPVTCLPPRESIASS